MIERVCVAGAGVIGSLFAGHLAQVADVSVLTRREDHARVLNEEGLRVSGRSDLHASLTASTDPAALPEPDLVLVCCKGTDLEDIAARLGGHFPAATVMTVQNGLGAWEIVGSHGSWPMLASVTFMSGTRHPTSTSSTSSTPPRGSGRCGTRATPTPRRVADLIRSSGLKAEAFDDLRPALWSKLIFNATVNAVAALTGLPHEPRFAQLERPSDLGHLVLALMDEGKAVAAAAGVELREDPWEMNVHATQRGSRHFPSMLEDVEAHRPTEIELITGSLVREGNRLGVPVPLHTALYQLVKAKEASWE